MAECVALYLHDPLDLRDGLDVAHYAEQHGFETVWQTESRLVRDAVVPMAVYAAVTRRNKVAEYARNGCTCPVLYTVCGDVLLLIESFSESGAL